MKISSTFLTVNILYSDKYRNLISRPHQEKKFEGLTTNCMRVNPERFNRIRIPVPNIEIPSL